MGKPSVKKIYPIMDGADPLYIKGNKTGLLFIHGFTGCPFEMKWLAKEFADKGFTVKVPRLPGHGTSPEDMMQYSYQDWLAYINQQYTELYEECDTVIPIGLSMGGAITSLLGALRFPKKMVMLSAPYRLPLTFFALFAFPFLKFIQVKTEGNILEPEAFKSHISYQGRVPVRAAWQLNRIVRKSRGFAAYITGDILLVQAVKDNVVRFHDMERWKKSCKKAKSIKTVTLTNSSHIVTRDYEKEVVRDQILDFITVD